MTATTSATPEYVASPTSVLRAANGIDYVYRELGDGAPPLVLLQHFRGNLENWDPALIDALASGRRVLAFDNVGVGGSTGTTPSTFAQMATDAVAFIDAMELENVDVLGFSIGSLVGQQIALVRPALVHRLVLASAAPQGAAGMHGWAPEVIAAVGQRAPNPSGYLDVFFTPSAVSRQSGLELLDRIAARAGSGQANDLANPTGAIRRGVRLGHSGSCAVAARRRYRHPGVHRERGRRLHDPAPLLLPTRGPDSRSTHQDLSGLGTRLTVPASRCIRGRRGAVPQRLRLSLRRGRSLARKPPGWVFVRRRIAAPPARMTPPPAVMVRLIPLSSRRV